MHMNQGRREADRKPFEEHPDKKSHEYQEAADEKHGNGNFLESRLILIFHIRISSVSRIWNDRIALLHIGYKDL